MHLLDMDERLPADVALRHNLERLVYGRRSGYNWQEQDEIPFGQLWNPDGRDPSMRVLTQEERDAINIRILKERGEYHEPPLRKVAPLTPEERSTASTPHPPPPLPVSEPDLRIEGDVACQFVKWMEETENHHTISKLRGTLSENSGGSLQLITNDSHARAINEAYWPIVLHYWNQWITENQ